MAQPASPDLAPQRSTKQSVLALVGFLLAVLVTAVVGAVASSDAKEKYAALDQPSWAPPSWLFGPAWGVLYVLIAIAGWLVWRRFGFDRAVQLWVVQLVLNALWSPLFFGAELYWGGVRRHLRPVGSRHRHHRAVPAPPLRRGLAHGAVPALDDVRRGAQPRHRDQELIAGVDPAVTVDPAPTNEQAPQAGGAPKRWLRPRRASRRSALPGSST